MQRIRLSAGNGTAESARRWADMRACRIKTSSMIERVAFDDDAGVLSVSFRQTGKYVYYDVSAAIFEALCKAVSAGASSMNRSRGVSSAAAIRNDGDSGQTPDRGQASPSTR